MKKFLKFIAILVLVITICFSGWFGSSQVAKIRGRNQNNKPADITIQNPTITFIGDSLTNGYYSDANLHADSYGYRQIVTETTRAHAFNFSVGGYTSVEVLEQLQDNVTIGETNQVILAKNKQNPELTNLYGNTADPMTMEDAIRQSDYVISTLGANDVMNEILIYNEDGSFEIDKKNLRSGLTNIYNRKIDIYRQINAINPDCKIIDVGMYMAYPHVSDAFTLGMYPVLVYTEGKIFIEDPEINTSKVIVRDNIQADIKTYIDNPDDIHPNQEGYEVIANEVLKHMQSLEDEKSTS